MKQETLFTIAESSIYYDPIVPCVKAANVGFLDSNEFRLFVDTALDFYIEKNTLHKKTGFLANAQDGDAADEETIKWIATDWNIRAFQAGLRYFAFVLSKDEYSLASIGAQTYIEESNRNPKQQSIIMRNFKDEESAKIWLKEVLN